MAYPEWVLRHKQPGMYVQKKDDDTYRIYRAHSERRPGKKYPVLVTDEYIGTITREHGLIRTPVKLKGDVLVKRYGGFCLYSRQIDEKTRRDSRCPDASGNHEPQGHHCLLRCDEYPDRDTDHHRRAQGVLHRGAERQSPDDARRVCLLFR